jgi:hypothetical protein
MEKIEQHTEAERLMLVKILTLIDQHERKQREFLMALEHFMRDVDQEDDNNEE